MSDRAILRTLFENGQRHIITPEITYTYEEGPNIKPNRLPDNDAVTDENGLHKINFALRNRWQTKWVPDIERAPREPLGGEWYRRKLAVEKAKETDPIDIIDWDTDIDLFMNPSRDNVFPRGDRVRRWSNLRSDLTFRESRTTTLFLDTEFNVQEAGQGGAAGFEVISTGVGYRPSRDVFFTLGYMYHIADASELRLAGEWEIDPKWHLALDVRQSLSGAGNVNRIVPDIIAALEDKA